MNIGQCECFTIDISQANSNKLIEFLYSLCKQSNDSGDALTPTLLRFPKRTAFSLFYPPIMQADPFLFVHGDKLYLFYEEMLLGKDLGYIRMTSTTDLRHWAKPITVLSEKGFHFSFPFVFEHDGKVYMMPETGDKHCVMLYLAENEDLTAFKEYKVVLTRPEMPKNLKFDFADSSIYKKDDIYYLFTSYCDDSTYYLQLFFSNKFDEGYTEHPCSPVCISNKYGRCAGSLIEANGRLFRPAQDCETVYGGQTHLMEITTLTPTLYEEHVFAENIIPQKEFFFKEGGHQINLTTFKGQTIVARDARFTTSFLFERIRLKALKLLHLKENKPY